MTQILLSKSLLYKAYKTLDFRYWLGSAQLSVFWAGQSHCYAASISHTLENVMWVCDLEESMGNLIHVGQSMETQEVNIVLGLSWKMSGAQGYSNGCASLWIWSYSQIKMNLRASVALWVKAAHMHRFTFLDCISLPTLLYSFSQKGEQKSMSWLMKSRGVL